MHKYPHSILSIQYISSVKVDRKLWKLYRWCLSKLCHIVIVWRLLIGWNMSWANQKTQKPPTEIYGITSLFLFCVKILKISGRGGYICVSIWFTYQFPIDVIPKELVRHDLCKSRFSIASQSIGWVLVEEAFENRICFYTKWSGDSYGLLQNH